MKLIALLALAGWCVYAADLCPAPRTVTSGGEDVASAHAKVGQKWCVRGEVWPRAGGVEVSWPAAGIENAAVAGPIEVAVCCFRHESAQPEKLRIGDRESVVNT